MNLKSIDKAIISSIRAFRAQVPIDTGNMRYNSVMLMRLSETRQILYINTNIAPYFKYVNGEWKSKKWNGKKNKNEGFFYRAAMAYVEDLAYRLNGRIEVI